MLRRPSQRAYNVEYYQRNRDIELERVRVRQAGMVDLLRDLRRVPCFDCGGRFKAYQMDFDHRDPSAKSFTVMAGRAMLMIHGEDPRGGSEVRRGVRQLPSSPNA